MYKEMKKNVTVFLAACLLVNTAFGAFAGSEHAAASEQSAEQEIETEQVTEKEIETESELPDIEESDECLLHDYEEQVTQEATCSEEGLKSFVCKVCTSSYSEAIPKLPHDYVVTVTKATEWAPGEILQVCENCHHRYARVLPKLILTPPARVKNVKAKVVRTDKAKRKKLPKTYQVRVSFNKVDQADGYVLQYALDKAFSRKRKRVIVKTGMEREVLIKNLRADTRYYFRIKAFRLDVSKKIYSEKWSRTVRVATPPEVKVQKTVPAAD